MKKARLGHVVANVAGSLLFVAGTTVAMAQQAADPAADERQIRQVVDSFLATRERNDADALAALLTPDVDQQVTSGATRAGRQAVVDGSLATTQRTGGRRTITIETIRFLSPAIAIADGPYDIVERLDGSARHYRTTMVLRKDNGTWRIAAIRNMQPTQ